MYEDGPSPLAIVCLTLIIGGNLKLEDTPEIVREEVNFFYPLIAGKNENKDNLE